MSSLSGAHFEADLPPPTGGATGADAAGGVGPSDIELIRKAQNGDRGAYGRLVTSYQDRLFNAIVRMVGDREEARELAQETFTRGLAKIESFRGDANPYTWLFRIATNLTISRLRKVQRRRTFSLDATGPAHGSRRSAAAGVAGANSRSWRWRGRS